MAPTTLERNACLSFRGAVTARLSFRYLQNRLVKTFSLQTQSERLCRLAALLPCALL